MKIEMDESEFARTSCRSVTYAMENFLMIRRGGGETAKRRNGETAKRRNGETAEFFGSRLVRQENSFLFLIQSILGLLKEKRSGRQRFLTEVNKGNEGSDGTRIWPADSAPSPPLATSAKGAKTQRG